MIGNQLNDELFDSGTSDDQTIFANDEDNISTCNGYLSSDEESVFNIDKDLEELEERVNGLDRDKTIVNNSAKSKLCATRHGCQGATNCDYEYASYPN